MTVPFKPAAAAALICFWMGGGGCVSVGPDGQTPSLTMNPQSSVRYQCGPTTLASVFAFHGVKVPEADITDVIYSPGARGVLLTDLARVARDRGFETHSGSGNLDTLRGAVAEGRPPIVLLDLGAAGFRVPHFTAVTGVTGEGVFLLSSTLKNDYLSHRKFKRQWTLAGNQFLILSPPSQSSR
ncbi:MAG: hypothetical protein JJU05_16035 [Verrucomicrobia bacterium]|nr:hypothetical protein [Verrucomicrobiota bacterium]MCH8528898.1 hypothetical protein [Kiritimatiellia bacterium]